MRNPFKFAAAGSQTSSDFAREKKDETQPDGNGVLGDVETGTVQLDLHRNLHGRHMQMIAIGTILDPALVCFGADEMIGGSIGAGLFVASGGALQSGGPASLLIGYIIIGVMILCTVEVNITITGR